MQPMRYFGVAVQSLTVGAVSPRPQVSSNVIPTRRTACKPGIRVLTRGDDSRAASNR